MTGYLTIEYDNEIVDARYFKGKHRMKQVIEIWKKRYAHLYYKAEVYITLQSKMNRLNYDY
jgi:hypothetical protein